MNQGMVTEIKLQNRKKDRVNVYVDNEFSFSCSTELVYRYDISKGKHLNLDNLKNVIEEDNYIKCKNTALNIIERNYITRKQMEDKLYKRGYVSVAVEKTIKFLEEYKFIDDRKYTQIYIQEKINSKGKKKIKYDLMKKGICEDVIDSFLDLIDDGKYYDSALKLASKKYRLMIKNKESINKIYYKIGNYLIRNGYDNYTTKNVLKNVIKKEDFNKQEKNYIKDNDALYEIAKKRYIIIIKSENDDDKIKRRLGQYLLRRGYSWESVKPILKRVMEKDILN